MARESKLGALAVRKGFASENEVQTALDLQKNLEPSADRPAAKVGEILVEMGALTGDMLEVLLEEQDVARRRAAEDVAETPAAVPRLIVRSAVPLSVNGQPVTSTTSLKAGDILKVGNAVIQVEALLSIVPSSEAPPEKPAEAPPPKKTAIQGMMGKVADIGTRFFKKKDVAPGEPAGPGLGEKLKNAAGRAGGAVKKMLKDAAKRKWTKDRLGANRRRDELLASIARAALRAGKLEGPEVDAARQSLRRLDEAEHTTSLRGSATTPQEASKIRQSIKAARDGVELALAKLGWLVLQKGPEPSGVAELVREVREIDEALSEPE